MGRSLPPPLGQSLIPELQEGPSPDCSIQMRSQQMLLPGWLRAGPLPLVPGTQPRLSGSWLSESV